jgi:hypothetical protein
VKPSFTSRKGRACRRLSPRTRALLLAAAALTALALGGEVARAAVGTPMTWPVQSDRPAVSQLVWPAPGDAAPPAHAWLQWPAPGDVTPPAHAWLPWPPPGDEGVRALASLQWPAPGDERARALASLRWPAPGDVTEVSLAVYFCRHGELVPVMRSVRLADRCCAKAVELLLAGPTAMEQYAAYESDIPAATEVLSTRVETGLAHVDLSAAFVRDQAPGAAPLAVGQLVYTATELAQIQAVELLVEGRSIATLAGVALPAHGISRSDWEELVH